MSQDVVFARRPMDFWGIGHFGYWKAGRAHRTSSEKASHSEESRDEAPPGHRDLATSGDPSPSAQDDGFVFLGDEDAPARRWEEREKRERQARRRRGCGVRRRTEMDFEEHGETSALRHFTARQTSARSLRPTLRHVIKYSVFAVTPLTDALRKFAVRGVQLLTIGAF
jgi:hypothetical protein